jgi:hypothetical protein
LIIDFHWINLTYVFSFVFSLNNDCEKNLWWVDGDGDGTVELLCWIGDGEVGVSTLRIILWSFNTRQIMSWLTMKYSISFSESEDRLEMTSVVDGINLSIKSWSARKRYSPTWSVFKEKNKKSIQNRKF